MNGSENKKLKLARAQLDRAVAELDDISIARLRAVRKRVVARAGHSRRVTWWLPLSTAAIATIVVVTLLVPISRTPDQASLASGEEAEQMMTKDPDFFTDLDFYDWLEAEHDAG